MITDVKYVTALLVTKIIIKHKCVKVVKISRCAQQKECNGKLFSNDDFQISFPILMTKPSKIYSNHHLFKSSGLQEYCTIATALKDVVSQIQSNVAGLGKEITASIVATENAYQHE